MCRLKLDLRKHKLLPEYSCLLPIGQQKSGERYILFIPKTITWNARNAGPLHDLCGWWKAALPAKVRVLVGGGTWPGSTSYL